MSPLGGSSTVGTGVPEDVTGVGEDDAGDKTEGHLEQAEEDVASAYEGHSLGSVGRRNER